MNFEQARFNMVEQQIRTWEVLDQGVLDLLLTVRREDFVPASYRTLAFADLEIPLGDGERMWTPKDVSAFLGGVPVATLYQWRHKGIGPKSRRVGRHLRYKPEDVRI